MKGLVSMADYERLERENQQLRDKIGELRQAADDARRLARQEIENEATAKAAPLVCGPIRVDFGSMVVSVSGHDSRLTPTEYRLVEALALTPGAFVPKWSIYDHLYRDPDLGPGMQVIGVFVCKVRRKLGFASGYIQCARGRGYRLVAPSVNA